MTPLQIAYEILQAMREKVRTKAEHDSAVLASPQGKGVTTEAIQAASRHANAAVRLSAALDADKVQRLAEAFVLLMAVSKPFAKWWESLGEENLAEPVRIDYRTISETYKKFGGV